MERKFWIFFLIFGVLKELQCIKIRLHKTVCNSLDESACRFDSCEVKPNKQNIPSFSADIKLLNGSIDTLVFQSEFYHVFGKNQLLMANRSFDFCEMITNKRKNSVAKFFIDIIATYTTINHSCPFKEDEIFIRNLAVKKFALPGPEGNYLFKMKAVANKKSLFRLDLYMKVIN
uniref:MD-2-related lipid-recognition domain-containing protein n=1 Tax=Stomoxys calcitrans TaxID=35570 RepID=A0A1I8Q3E6_STOCA